MLMAAAVGGASGVVRKLLKLSASLAACNTLGLTALMAATQSPVHSEATAIAGMLLRAGASPNRKSSEGATALVYAVEKSGEVLESLLDESNVTKLFEASQLQNQFKSIMF